MAAVLDPEVRDRLLRQIGLPVQTVRFVDPDLPHASTGTGKPPQARHDGLVRLGIVDDDEPDDDAVAAVLDALARFDARAKFDSTKHPRVPSGHEGGGRFRKLSDTLFEALKDWLKGDKKGDPFLKVLSPDPAKRREQIRRVARERGITLRRGATYDEIAKALFDDLQKNVGKPETPKKPAVSKALPAPKAPRADLQRKAIDRQKKIDRARGVADALAEFGQLRGYDSEPDVIESRVRATGKRNGLDAELVDSLVAAAKSDDEAHAALVLERLENKHGLTRHSAFAGGVEPYDPARHDAPEKPRPKAGAWVLVDKPGFDADVEGESVRLSKAVVYRATPDEVAVEKREIGRLERMADRDLQDLAAEAEISGARDMDKTQLVRELRRRGVSRPPTDPTSYRQELDDHLFNIGRRRPVRAQPFDDAAQALADGEDRKSVALELKRAALADKQLSQEDLRTYELLAGEIRRTKPRPAWLTDQHTILLDKLVGEQAPHIDLSKISNQDVRDWVTGKSRRYDPALNWAVTFERVRLHLEKGRMTRAKAAKELADMAGFMEQRISMLRTKKDNWLKSHDRSPWAVANLKPSKLEEDVLIEGPARAKAYLDLATFLKTAKIPAAPRQRSLGGTELGEVLPIDETSFSAARFHDALSIRGQSLDTSFRHQQIFLFAPGATRPRRAGLTDAENDALDHYTVGRLARALNGSLRKGRNHHGEVAFPEIGLNDPIDLDDVRRDMDLAIDASELPRDTVLYRGVLLKTADRNRLVPGAILSDPGYTSTTTVEADADKVIRNWTAAGLYKGTKPAKFKILAPSGTHGAPGHQAVHEIVMARDQKFRIVREETGSDGIPVFVLEAVQPETSSGLVRGRALLDTFDYQHLPSTSLGGVDSFALQQRVWQQQGFDGLPKVVSRDEMDTAVRRGGVEIFRGVRADDPAAANGYAEQFRTGAYHYGTGGVLYGRGTYAATDRTVAEGYSGGQNGAIIRMMLRRDARVVDYEELRKLHRKALPKALRRLDELQQAELDKVDPSDTDKIREILARYGKLRASSSKRGQAVADFGVFAALSGYDAISVTQSGKDRYYVIVNRTAVLVEEAAP